MAINLWPNSGCVFMDLNLKDKKVFVSGASQGIGFWIAKKFIEEGANVVINSRDSHKLHTATLSLGNCGSVNGDVSNPIKTFIFDIVSNEEGCITTKHYVTISPDAQCL